MASPNEPDPPNEPEAEFGDSHRQKLLEKLSNALNTEIPPTAWACLWLADIARLEEIVEEAQQKKPFPWVTIFRDMEVSTRIVPLWIQRKRAVSAPCTPQKRRASEQETPSTRSKPQRGLCHERDNKKCVLTKAGEPNEVAHIYPFSMRGEKRDSLNQTPSFWNTLLLFWSEERVNAWYDAICPQGTEVCCNLMCLSPNAHQYWTRAYFALKPISLSEDKRRLDIQFFWLSSNPYIPAVEICQVPSLSATKDQGPNLSKLWNHETNEMIRSGDMVSLETDDPDSRPLPDIRLLEMQWILHRVAAMRGFAEVQDDFHSCSDDGEDEEAVCDWESSAEDYEAAWQDDIVNIAKRF